MGIDTVFFVTEITIIAEKNVKNSGKKIMDLYKKKHTKLKVDISFGDWFVDAGDVEDGDDILIKLNGKAHRGGAEDFVPNLLIMLETVKHFGFYVTDTTLPFFTTWGDSLSGVLTVNEHGINIVEVYPSGDVVRRDVAYEDVVDICGDCSKLFKKIKESTITLC